MDLIAMLPNLEDALSGAGKVMDELKGTLDKILASLERIEERQAALERAIDALAE